MHIREGFFVSESWLLERYMSGVFELLSDRQQGLLLEARTRLEQLSYSVDRCEAAAQRQAAIWQAERIDWETRHPLADAPSVPKPTPRQRELLEATFETRYFAESFYYFGARLQKILDRRRNSWPHLQFREVTGIRKVRNDLLEHPEGPRSQVFAGGKQATVEPFNLWLKVPQSLAGMQEPLDPGLIENASALRAELDRSLRAALASVE
jgi:hypothetical protein